MKSILARAAVRELPAGVRIGIEVGQSAIKLVELARVGGEFVLRRFAVEPLPAGVVIEGEIQDYARLTERLAALRKRLGFGRVPVVTAIADGAVQYKVLRVEKAMESRKVLALAHREARTLIRDPDLEVSVDIAYLGEAVMGTEMRELLLVAARSKDVQRFATCFRRAGWEPEIVDVEGLTSRFGVESPPQPHYNGDGSAVTAMFDIGASGISMSVIRRDEVVFHREQSWPSPSCNIFGDEAAHGPLIECVRSLSQAFYRHTGIEHLDRLQVTGGLSNDERCVTEIADWMGLPVSRWRIEDQVQVDSSVNPVELSDVASRLFVALSLAKRGFA